MLQEQVHLLHQNFRISSGGGIYPRRIPQLHEPQEQMEVLETPMTESRRMGHGALGIRIERTKRQSQLAPK
jgi:hypothetical protein